MCGLAGLALRQGLTPDSATLDALTKALAHRGPDGAGHHVAGNVALAHTRLAIIDLVTGDQPLFAGPAALVANGEVYNYRELREANQLRCTTGSDCEPPLHLWRRDGIGFAETLRGMYAIALQDRAARQVVLARDPFGIKPLYTAEVPGGIAFASEPQALIAAGLVQPRVRAAARAELLQLQFTTGAETIFEGITRVLPGETIVIADGAVTERRRRAALPEGGPESITAEAALARLDAALEESVLLHQRSDVPYGMFLSGGIDSATVLAMMARLNDRRQPLPPPPRQCRHARPTAANAAHPPGRSCPGPTWCVRPATTASWRFDSADSRRRSRHRPHHTTPPSHPAARAVPGTRSG